MSKHTPGPWGCVPGEFFSVYRYEGGEPTAVTKTEANAQLIAASPELLEALRDASQTLAWLAHGKCRGFSDGLLTASDALDKARAAIKKAEGEA